MVHEILHSLKCRSDDKIRDMAIKLDTTKAYDDVEWKFLTSMMENLGFVREFCARIEECILSISYSVLINGNPIGFIKPSRGLRQGDPLLPFLFLICTEGFSALLKKSEDLGLFHGFKIPIMVL